MPDVILREAVPQDAGPLTELWCGVFGDPPELVDVFFSLLPEMGSGCVAEREGRILAAAYLIHGFTLLRQGEPPLRCGYLYAVATEPSARGQGLGSAVSRGAAELGRLHGARLLCTLPAEASLYRWYGDILSLKHRISRRRLFCDRLPEARPLPASEYLSLREALLRDHPHVRPDAAAMEFEAALCRSCGGGLYAADGAIFCAYPDEGAWVIPEFLPCSAEGLLPGLRVESAPYLCSDLPVPDGTVWNLSFD